MTENQKILERSNRLRKIKNKEVWAAPQYSSIPDLASSDHIFKMADVGNTDW